MSLIIDGTIALANGAIIPPIELSIYDSMGSYGTFYTTQSDVAGNFHMEINYPYDDLISLGTITMELRVTYDGSTIVHQEPLAYPVNGPVIINVDPGTYGTAVNDGANGDPIYINGSVMFTGSTSLPAEVDIELWDDANVYGMLASQTTSSGGFFSFYVGQPECGLIRVGVIKPRYKVITNGIAVYDQHWPFVENTDVNIEIEETDYNNAQDLTINGCVRLTTSEPLQDVTVELWDGNTTYGMLDDVVTDSSGNFSFQLSQPYATFIRQSEITTRYKLYFNGVLIHDTGTITFVEDDTVCIDVDPGDYNNARDLIINGTVKLSTGDELSSVKVELWDGNSTYGYLGYANTDGSGNFTFNITQPNAGLIRSSSLLPSYKVYFDGEVLILDTGTSISFVEDDNVDLTVGLDDYYSANPVVITGSITTCNQLTAPQVSVELHDANGIFGFIGSVTSDTNGSFTFSTQTNLTGSQGHFIKTAELSPKYKMYFGELLVGEEQHAYVQGQPLQLEVDSYPIIMSGIATARAQIETYDSIVQANAEAVKTAEVLLQSAVVNGASAGTISMLQADLSAKTTTLNTSRSTRTVFQDEEQMHILRMNECFPIHGNMIEKMSDSVPILFFPVRIETVFAGVENARELWVRIFPDDIAVDTHEELLTQDEIDAGQSYWTTHDATSDEAVHKAAWNVIAQAFTAQRAAWILKKTKKVGGVFPTLQAKPYSWGKQPVTKVMPDRFVIIGYSSNDYSSPAFSVQTNIIPDKLPMGPDPGVTAQDTFVQSNGDISTPQGDMDWMLDFDVAIAKGLGKKILLTNTQYNNGFDRIIVLGVKATLNKTDSQARLEQLIDAHHYKSGFSLLKQGTSTSNTETEHSGYTSHEFGNATTFATECEDELFVPTTNIKAKTDGQILCEALGIEFSTLEHIYHSDGKDLLTAMSINNSLFQVSAGYPAGSFLQISQAMVDQLRDFFAEFVRARGALPSIRSGIQPYGILPVSVFSRMNWVTDVYKDLYNGIHEISVKLSTHWNDVVATMAPGGFIGTSGQSPNQAVVDFLSKPALSTGLMQRLGFGPGYIWNNLMLAAIDEPTKPQTWRTDQINRMNQLETDLDMTWTEKPRIAQMNFHEEHVKVTKPLVADSSVPLDAPLPELASSGKNYLQLIADASFEQLRDENYGAFTISDNDVPDTMFYLFARQSMLLEYYDAAAKILDIPDAAKIDPELINISVPHPGGEPTWSYQHQTTEDFSLYTGNSRWELLEMPYGGYSSIGAYLSSSAANSNSYAANLLSVKEGLHTLAAVTVGDLNMLVTEVVDSVTFRLDTWRLALVNQRLNAVRGITDGSSARQKGIYLGAYGWVENVKNRGARTYLPNLEKLSNSSNFSLPIQTDSSNKGFIHAPSIGQAAAATVLRSGFVNNGKSNSNSSFSVNISSERVRGALQLLDGIRNGQQLSVMLGYEFERKVHDMHQSLNLDQFIVPLRNAYPLKNTISTITTEGTEEVKARNVVNGVELINAFKTPALGNMLDALPAMTPTFKAAILAEAAHIADLMDAVGDLTTAESVYQMVQGNQTRSAAMSDAISRGANIPEIEHIKTPRTGLTVNQKLTMHFELNTSLPGSWSELDVTSPINFKTARSTAEPYLNRWIAEILGDSTDMKVVVAKVDTTPLETSVVNISDLKIQPIDLVYMTGDRLSNDDSEFALRIRRHLRTPVGSPTPVAWATGIDKLKIYYSPEDADEPGDAAAANMDIYLPILRYIKAIIANGRPLSTLDYVPVFTAHEAPQAIINNCDFADVFARVDVAIDAFETAANALKAQADSSNPDFGIIRTSLASLSQFGLTQTLYEYVDNDSQAERILKEYAQVVSKEAQRRLKESNPKYPNADDTYPALAPTPANAGEADVFLNKAMAKMKAIFGKEFVFLPKFKLRPEDAATLDDLLDNGYYDLLDDQEDKDLVTDEWLAGIAKVKRNAAEYEMLTILASTINEDAFDGDRKLHPLQLPCTATDKWLGAGVNNVSDVKPGRTVYGASLPQGHRFTETTSRPYQVGILVDDWVDVIPVMDETTGVGFHFNQPNAKPPQSLLLGLTPVITGTWAWADLVDMINETFTLAKTRAVTYEQLTATPVAQVVPGMLIPYTGNYATIGLTGNQIMITP